MRVPREQQLIQRPGTDPRHKNKDIEFSAFDFGQKLHRGAVLAQRHFAHGRGKDGLTAVTTNQLRHLFRAAALEGYNFKPVQVLSRTHAPPDSPKLG